MVRQILIFAFLASLFSCGNDNGAIYTAVVKITESDCETPVSVALVCRTDDSAGNHNHETIYPVSGNHYEISVSAIAMKNEYAVMKVQQGFNSSLNPCTRSFKYIIYRNSEPVDYGWVENTVEFYTNNIQQ